MWPPVSPVNTILIYGVIFTSTRMLVGAISAVYLLARGVNVVDIAFIKAFQAGIILLLDIPLAYIADKKSRKLSLIAAVSFSVLWLITMGLGNSLASFYLAEFFNAVSLALLSGSATAYLVDKQLEINNDDKAIQYIIGKFSKYQHIGMGLCAFAGSLFIEIDSRTIWFVAAAILSVQLLGLSWLLPKDTQHHEEEAEQLTPYKEIFNIFKDLLYRKSLSWFAGSLMFVMIYYQVIIQFWQILINAEATVLYQQGYIYGLVFTAILFVQSYSGHIAQKLTKRTTALIVLLSMLPQLLVILLPERYVIYGVILTVIFIFFSIRLMGIVLESVIHERISSKMRSTYSSVISSIVRIILLLIIPVSGMAIKEFGHASFQIPFAVTVVIYIVALSLLQPKPIENNQQQR